MAAHAPLAAVTCRACSRAWSAARELGDGGDETVGAVAVERVDVHLEQRADVANLLRVPREGAHTETVEQRHQARGPLVAVQVDRVDAVLGERRGVPFD